jgi:PP-loop family
VASAAITGTVLDNVDDEYGTNMEIRNNGTLLYWVRPLLNVRKQELVRYLQQNNFTWREDISNQSNKYLRNRIRNELIPLLHDMQEIDDCPSSKGTNVLERRFDNLQQHQPSDIRKHKTTFPRTPSIDRSYSYRTKDITITIINGIEGELNVLGSSHLVMYISRYIAPVPLIGVGTTYKSITIVRRIKIVFVPPQQGQVFIRSPQLAPVANRMRIPQ